MLFCLGVDASPIEDPQCRLQLNTDDSTTALVQFTVSGVHVHYIV